MVDVRVDDGRADARTVARDYSRVLDTSFTQAERHDLNVAGGVRIVVRDLPGDEMARYAGKVAGKPTIYVSPACAADPETYRHETIHVLQDYGSDRPPLDGQLTRSDLRRDPDRAALKEALTEEETMARSPTVSADPGYYEDVRRTARTAGLTDAELKRQDAAQIRAVAGDRPTAVYDHPRCSELRRLQLRPDGPTADQVRRRL